MSVLYIISRRCAAILTLNVLPLLKARGKTKYWLNKQLGMSYTNFNKMVHNQTRSIQYKHIEII